MKITITETYVYECEMDLRKDAGRRLDVLDFNRHNNGKEILKHIGAALKSGYPTYIVKASSGNDK